MFVIGNLKVAALTYMCMMVSGFLGMAGVSNTPSWSMLVRDDYCSNKSPNGANIREK